MTRYVITNGDVFLVPAIPEEDFYAKTAGETGALLNSTFVTKLDRSCLFVNRRTATVYLSLLEETIQAASDQQLGNFPVSIQELFVELVDVKLQYTVSEVEAATG